MEPLIESAACLSVIIPAYNEESTLENVVHKVLKLPQVIEIIVVDDGSTDGTPAVCARLSHLPKVRTIRLARNRGKCAALKAGFAVSTGEIVIVQDADLEYDPADYPALIQPILANRADVVFGSRFNGAGAHRVLYYWHAIGNRLLTTLSNIATNLNLSDMETCYKVFRREIIQAIPIQEDRFGFEPEITAKVARAGVRIYEVPISYYGRTYAEGKKINWRDGVQALVCILKYNFT